MRRAIIASLLALTVSACTSAAATGAAPPSTRAAAPIPTNPVPATPVPSTAGTTTTASTTSTTDGPVGPPYPLTRQTFGLVDTSRPTVSHGHQISATRSLPTTVWAPAAPGPWPLVVFAHGFSVGPAPYTALVQAWAAHGYVVAVPSFPLTDQSRAGPYLDEGDIDNQPADVRFVTDWLVSPASPVAGRIDRRRVAVAGHSDGAETALAAATDPTPAGQPRYDAVLVLSGQAVPGAAGRNPPALVAQGSADDINPPSLGLGAYSQAASPKYLLMIEGAGHLPPYSAGSPWLAGVEATTEAFLDIYCAGDAPVRALAATARRFPALELTAG